MNTEESIKHLFSDGRKRTINRTYDELTSALGEYNLKVKARTVARWLQKIEGTEPVYDKKGVCYYRLKFWGPDWLRAIYYYLKRFKTEGI
jgi:arginine repressor